MVASLDSVNMADAGTRESSRSRVGSNVSTNVDQVVAHLLTILRVAAAGSACGISLRARRQTEKSPLVLFYGGKRG